MKALKPIIPALQFESQLQGRGLPGTAFQHSPVAKKIKSPVEFTFPKQFMLTVNQVTFEEKV